MLVTHCAPALRLNNERDPNSITWEPGTITHWRWLGFNRYFPTATPQHTVGRCISDFQESSSFHVTAVAALPIIKSQPAHISHSPHVHLYCTPSHDPLVLLSSPATNTIGMVNVKDLPQPNAQRFPEDARLYSQMTQQLHLDDDDDDPEDEGDSRPTLPQVAIPNLSEPWVIDIEARRDEHIEASTMGMDGRMIVGVGSKGTVWVWLAEGQCFRSVSPVV